MPRLAPDAWRDRRVVVVVAHPDDEVIGCGALLAGLRDARVVQVTDGSPADPADARRHGFATREAYREARWTESRASLALAGLASDRLHRLGIADQDAAAHLAAIAEALRPWLDDAEVVLTHAYEGGHPDHDAVAFAVHAANRKHCAPPELIEMPYYYGDREGWVRQRFLGDEALACLRVLTTDERALKQRMLAAHASQAETLAAFCCDTERFRRAPLYAFSTRPHAGPLLYERHGWNLTWPVWRERVLAASAALGIAPA